MDKTIEDFKEKLEYALTQAQPPWHMEYPYFYETLRFNHVVEEISKLDLLPDGAYKRLIVKD